MAILPKIQAYDGALEVTDVFRGLNRAEKIAEGEWSDERNLTADRYPMLSVRGKRSSVRDIDGYICSILAKEKLAVLEVPNSYYSLIEAGEQCAIGCNLWYGDAALPVFFPFVYPDYFPGKMISFGAYIIITGINAYYNTATGESGFLDIEYTIPEPTEPTPGSQLPARYNTVLRLYPVDENGNELTIKAQLTEADATTLEGSASPGYNDGECYAIHDTRTIRQYVNDGVDTPYWRTVPNRAKYEADGIESGQALGNDLMPASPFREGNSVNVSGMWMADGEYGGIKTVVSTGTDYIILRDVFVEYTVREYSYAYLTRHGDVPKVARTMPKMDYVIECQNRLWGCFYGEKDGKPVNELYCSELGRFDVWDNYDGTSMASWAASVGTDGAWTGAVSYQGKPHFFKEKHLHKIYISASGAHQVVDTPVLGVQDGCSGSLCVIDGALFYMSRDGVCAFDGSTPTVISRDLGKIICEHASFGGTHGKLYCDVFGVRNGETVPELYTYDIQRGLWHEESRGGLDPIMAFAPLGDSLYACGAGLGMFLPGGEDSTTLWDLNGLGGMAEDAVSYRATSGLIGWQNIEQKYVSRFDMRLTLPEGATMKVEIEYDSSGNWEEQGSVSGGGVGSIMIPVRPRRCDHFRIRLSGSGEMRMYSFAKRLTKGSDRV